MSEGNIGELLAKANQLIQKRAWEEAIETFDIVISIDSSCSDAWYEKGKVLNRLGLVEESLQAFQSVVNINPEDTDGWYNIGVCLSKLGRNEESLNAFQEAKRLNPVNKNAFQLDDTNILGILGGDSEALKAFESATRSQSGNFYRNQRFCYGFNLEFLWDDGEIEILHAQEESSSELHITSKRYPQCSLIVETKERIPCDYSAKELVVDLAKMQASEDDDGWFYVFENGLLPAYVLRSYREDGQEIWIDIIATDRFVYQLERAVNPEEAASVQFAEKAILNLVL